MGIALVRGQLDGVGLGLGLLRVGVAGDTLVGVAEHPPDDALADHLGGTAARLGLGLGLGLDLGGGLLFLGDRGVLLVLVALLRVAVGLGVGFALFFFV